MKKRHSPKPKAKKALKDKSHEKSVLKQELEMFNRIIDGMRNELSYVDLLKLTVTCVCKGLGYDRAGIFLVEPDGKSIARAIGVDARGKFEVGYTYKDPILDKKGFSIFSDLVFGYKKSFYTSNLLERFPELVGKVDKGVTCNANVPILVGKKRIIGVLAVDNLFTHRELTPQDISSLSNFAIQAGMAIETIRLHEQVRQLSVTDSLTQIYNRRYFEKFLADELDRSRRYKHPCGVLYLDLDHFKQVNDQFGHPVGDELLKNVAQILKKALRNIDVVARLGGDEFGVILPETPAQDVVLVAQRLLNTVEKARAPLAQLEACLHPVTFSIGVATFPDSADKPDDLVKMADKSLYEAKNAGRNQVGSFPRK
jgi:diguanylate cyclase (GGDEF)-like protein